MKCSLVLHKSLKINRLFLQNSTIFIYIPVTTVPNIPELIDIRQNEIINNL